MTYFSIRLVLVKYHLVLGLCLRNIMYCTPVLLFFKTHNFYVPIAVNIFPVAMRYLFRMKISLYRIVLKCHFKLFINNHICVHYSLKSGRFV
jgi:hypothetical protein